MLRPAAALEAALRQRSVLEETSHRPWPLPERPWFMGQTWRHLLFAHWQVEAARLAERIPPQLPLDTRDGSAWIGVTPFGVEGLRLRRLPPPPIVSRFLEVNVRTYVTLDGKPGIYFLSLDASSRLAVSVARRTYRLPYFHSRISMRVSEDGKPAELGRPGPPGRHSPSSLAASGGCVSEAFLRIDMNTSSPRGLVV
jgi:uncharacterized protein YqjF (DUF2071 family)